MRDWLAVKVTEGLFPSERVVHFLDADHTPVSVSVQREGTRLVCGVNGAPIAEEIHRANMDKDAVGDLKKPTKPEGWKPPDVRGELEKQGWKS